MKDVLPELQNLGRWLLKARGRAGLTQRQLAQRCGLDQTTISRIEQGIREPTLAQLLILAKTLAVPLQWFLNGEGWPGVELRDIAVQLQFLGVVDLFVPQAVTPGGFRPVEQAIALAVSGNRPQPRVVEAIPSVLAWNAWQVPLLQAYSKLVDPLRGAARLGWLAEIALAIHEDQGFPGGCPQQKQLEDFVEWASEPVNRPVREDSLGYPTRVNLPPIWKRWRITCDASLATFRDRAKHLHALREQRSPDRVSRKARRT
jgi:transcriptional regulator with XRE-family HTH domain